MNTVTHGLYITVIGMGLVFVTLGVILFLMALLTKLFPAKTLTSPKFTTKTTNEESPDMDNEKIAAISVVLIKAMTEERRTVPLPEMIIPQTIHSAWVTTGRARQLNHPKTRNKSL